MIVANDAFSLTPSKLSFFTRFDRVSSTLDTPPATANRVKRPGVKKSFHNFELSKAAQRTMRNKINWLFAMAKKHQVQTATGKRIYSFKAAFMTFTLPSKQVHPTAEITRDCFNSLLTSLRTRFKMENYVWRLEFQQNGNVHYHLVTDTYVDYYELRRIWNATLAKKGYVQAYHERHSKMTLSQYASTYAKPGVTTFAQLAKAYAKGKASNWSNPPSVDVKSATSKTRIGLYISKYFGKKAKNQVKCSPLDNEENSESLRLWFCSRSLSRMKSISEYFFTVDYDPYAIVKALKKAYKVRSKWAFSVFFDLLDLSPWIRGFVERLLKDYAKSQGYRPWEITDLNPIN